ncbi:hypothetical protein M0802_001531 [Mischocyttarus mexicanus]|nr:hypothetical protein M0802_001531 [Mischocyttarus mexicanus]
MSLQVQAQVQRPARYTPQETVKNCFFFTVPVEVKTKQFVTAKGRVFKNRRVVTPFKVRKDRYPSEGANLRSPFGFPSLGCADIIKDTTPTSRDYPKDDENIHTARDERGCAYLPIVNTIPTKTLELFAQFSSKSNIL